MRKKQHGRPSVHWKKRWVDIYLNLVFRLIFVGWDVIEVRKLGLERFLCLTCVINILTSHGVYFLTGYQVCEGWQKCFNFLLTKQLKDFRLFFWSRIKLEYFQSDRKLYSNKVLLVWLSVCLFVCLFVSPDVTTFW